MRVSKKPIEKTAPTPTLEPAAVTPPTLELEPIEPAAEQPAPERQLRCADGVSVLINPYTQQVFTQAPVTPVTDGWVSAQLEAGKLQQC